MGALLGALLGVILVGKIPLFDPGKVFALIEWPRVFSEDSTLDQVLNAISTRGEKSVCLMGGLILPHVWGKTTDFSQVNKVPLTNFL